MQWIKQLFSRSKPSIPDPLWQATIARLPFLHFLGSQDLAALKHLCEQLLDKKTMTGAGGLELTDDIAVMIAAQACLPVLHLTLDLYDDMAGIIVYPAEFVVPQAEVDEAGVVHEWREPVSGEAIGAGGAVVLSWQDADAFDVPGYNVVIHEFAHKIDMGNGDANGCPPFLSAFHRDIGLQEWKEAFSSAYDDFLSRVESLDAGLPENFDPDDPHHAQHYDELFASLPLDPYATQNPAEFFAVATEAFFVQPTPLAQAYPRVYDLLSRYYRQDPMISRA
ncbi:MAG TPA: M90 family metallopeptidase [Noviherbaspirillum sp.]|uniref:M90 family metallopeptidase n=1 Tax=Noviherbaspirillum sp. TaxID=1926288 RepID=UPI002DDD7600|nr:M90 family metallopeptidase [Noviherbaspirillum sp.]HEV2611999.1 M90 family metallopeptidase [Noviherbaspirillum sp.]